MFFVLLALCIYADYFSIYRIKVSLKFTKCTQWICSLSASILNSKILSRPSSLDDTTTDRNPTHPPKSTNKTGKG